MHGSPHGRLHACRTWPCAAASCSRTAPDRPQPRLRRPAAVLRAGADDGDRRRAASGSTRPSSRAATSSRPRRCRTATPSGALYDSGDYAALPRRGARAGRLRRARASGRGAPGRRPAGRHRPGLRRRAVDLEHGLHHARPDRRGARAGAAQVGQRRGRRRSPSARTAASPCGFTTTPQGQGHRTVGAQVVADVLGVDPSDVDVHVRDADTASEPVDGLLGQLLVPLRRHGAAPSPRRSRLAAGCGRSRRRPGVDGRVAAGARARDEHAGLAAPARRHRALESRRACRRASRARPRGGRLLAPPTLDPPDADDRVELVGGATASSSTSALVEVDRETGEVERARLRHGPRRRAASSTRCSPTARSSAASPTASAPRCSSGTSTTRRQPDDRAPSSTTCRRRRTELPPVRIGHRSIAVARDAARRQGPRRGQHDERAGRDRERRRRRDRPRRRRAAADPAAGVGAAAREHKPLEPQVGALVKPAAFDYVAAGSLEEALAALAEQAARTRSRSPAGRASCPLLNLRLVAPDAARRPQPRAGLDAIEANGSCASAPLVRQRALEHDPRERSRLLARGAAPRRARRDAQPRHRRRRVAHADGAAELPLCLRALGGTVVVEGPRGRREIAADDLFVTHYLTTLEPDELVVETPAGRGRAPGDGVRGGRAAPRRLRPRDGRLRAAAGRRRRAGRPHPRRRRHRPADRAHRGRGARSRAPPSTRGLGRRRGCARSRAVDPPDRCTPRPPTCGTSPGRSSSGPLLRAWERGGMTEISAHRQRPARRRGRRAAAAADRLPPPSPRPARHARRLRARRLRRLHGAARRRRGARAAACSPCRPTAAAVETVEALAGRRAACRRCRRRSGATTRCSAASARPGILMRRRGPALAAASADRRARRSSTCSRATSAAARATPRSSTRSRTPETRLTSAEADVNLAQSLLAACERQPELEAFAGTPLRRAAARALRAIAGGPRRGARRPGRGRPRQPPRDGAALLGGQWAGAVLVPLSWRLVRGRARLLHRPTRGPRVVLRDGDPLPDGPGAPWRARRATSARSR